jgi:hypothetical protein
MKETKQVDTVELELTISENDSEFIAKLKRIIEDSSHKLPTT